MSARSGALAAEMRERRPVNPSGASLFKLGGYGEEDSNDSGAEQLPDRFPDQRSAALALLNGDARLTRQAGSFLGQLAVDPTPLSEKQSAWLATLLDRAGLPPLAGGGGFAAGGRVDGPTAAASNGRNCRSKERHR